MHSLTPAPGAVNPDLWLDLFVKIAGILLSVLSVGFSIWALLSTRKREDSKTRAERIAAEKARIARIERDIEEDRAALASAVERFNERMLGFQQQHERYAERTDGRLDETTKALHQIEALRAEQHNTAKALERLENQTRDLNQNIIELLKRK